MKKHYVSWERMKNHCHDIIRQMGEDSWKPEIIIGITRGGALPAILISHYLEIKMVGMDVSLKEDDAYGPESNAWAAEDAMKGKKTLIVDDINDTGATINWIMKDWGRDIKWGDNVRFAVVVDNLASKADIKVSYCGEEINKAEDPCWVVFPYEEWWK